VSIIIKKYKYIKNINKKYLKNYFFKKKNEKRKSSQWGWLRPTPAPGQPLKDVKEGGNSSLCLT
jgi:hypothetical protein